MSKEKEPVVFRVFRDTGDCLALFPFIPSDNAGYQCLCYQHLGQHSGGYPLICRGITRPAKPKEYRDLARELRGLGYNLRVLKRVPRNALQARQRTLKEWDESAKSKAKQ